MYYSEHILNKSVLVFIMYHKKAKHLPLYPSIRFTYTIIDM